MKTLRKALGKLNGLLADGLADTLSSMLFFYGLLLLITLPLRWQTPEGPVQWINFLSSNFFQALALPVLAYNSKREGRIIRVLLQETHDTVMIQLKLLRDVRQAEMDELACFRKLIEPLALVEIAGDKLEKMSSRSKRRQRNAGKREKKGAL